jgi:hypothetical protein
MGPLELVAAILEAVLTEPPPQGVLIALRSARDAVLTDEAAVAARDLVRALRSDSSPSCQVALQLLSAALAAPKDDVRIDGRSPLSSTDQP